MAKEQQSPAGSHPHAEPKKAPEAPKKGKEHTVLPGGCRAVGCKTPAHRFDFCDEHYDQFKFGLIKKSGELVPDHEKKLEHYLAWKGKKSAHRVA